jgi:hypothetical protein
MITDARRTKLYPQPDEVGEEDTWLLPLDHGGELEVFGVFLGVASARQDKHNHGGRFTPQDRRCPACRWYEPRIFRETDGARRYVLYTLGCSDMPGETDRPRYRYASDAHEAIFTMSTPKGDTRFLTAPARSLFEMAARRDDEIRQALENQWSTGEADLVPGPQWRR